VRSANLPPAAMKILHDKQKDVFNGIMAKAAADPTLARTFAFRARPYGITDAYEVFTEVEKYNLRDVAANIRTPLLITNPEDEQFWPGQSQALFDLVKCEKQMLHFERKEGANMHCEPMARKLVDLRMFDWFEDQLAARAKAK
jgi:hypothetical protein